MGSRVPGPISGLWIDAVLLDVVVKQQNGISQAASIHVLSSHWENIELPTSEPHTAYQKKPFKVFCQCWQFFGLVLLLARLTNESPSTRLDGFV